MTFGFHTAVDIATEVIDRIHTTAGSHSRVMCIEIMGNKAGWLTLYSGIAGGADIILLPELPYDIKKVAAAVENRAKAGKNFSILAVAEGAFSTEEAKMKRKEWTAKRAEAGYTTATARIAKQIEEMTGAETRICVPGHMQRGGSPSAYDRVLATQFGSLRCRSRGGRALRRDRRHGQPPCDRQPAGRHCRQDPRRARRLRHAERRPCHGHQPGLIFPANHNRSPAIFRQGSGCFFPVIPDKIPQRLQPCGVKAEFIGKVRLIARVAPQKFRRWLLRPSVR